MSKEEIQEMTAYSLEMAKYTGERLSKEEKKAELKEFLRKMEELVEKLTTKLDWSDNDESNT